MATYNANTVREEARLEELAHCAEEREWRSWQSRSIGECTRISQSTIAEWGGAHSSPHPHGVMMPRQQQVAWDSW